MMGLNLLPIFVFRVLSFRKMERLEVGNNRLTVRPIKNVTSSEIQKLHKLFSKRYFKAFSSQIDILNFRFSTSTITV